MTARRKLLAAMGALAALSACAEGQSSGGTALALPADTSTESFYATLERDGAGFKVGPASAKKPIYVVFDPQCPHCGSYWALLRQNPPPRTVVWVPIAMLRAPANRPQGATLLEAANPQTLMDDHERSISKRGGGISALNPPEAGLKKFDRNTQIARHFNLQAVPATLVPQADGKVLLATGAPTLAQLQQIF